MDIHTCLRPMTTKEGNLMIEALWALDGRGRPLMRQTRPHSPRPVCRHRGGFDAGEMLSFSSCHAPPVLALPRDESSFSRVRRLCLCVFTRGYRTAGSEHTWGGNTKANSCLFVPLKNETRSSSFPLSLSPSHVPHKVPDEFLLGK